jgi:hypothetical protein
VLNLNTRLIMSTMSGFLIAPDGCRCASAAM